MNWVVKYILSVFLIIGLMCLPACELSFLPGEGETILFTSEENPKEEEKDKEKNDDGKKDSEENENEEDKKTNDADSETLEKDDISIEEIQVEDRKWTILVYMAADNNLEASAIEDFSEMELSTLNTNSVSVFVLLDRSAAYDTSNGNWNGTKLFRLKTGKSEASRKLISEEIECKELGLQVGINTELDMSSAYVLSDCIQYLRSKFPAENYGLIMWGHGTGWRSEVIEDQNIDYYSPGGIKGFAFDDDSKTYMTLKQLNSAVNSGMDGNKLDFLGFDTCFGAEIEVLYELRDNVKFSVGSEGLLMSSGWNYKSIFNSIQNDKNKTAQSICEIIGKDFAERYKNTSGASIVVVKMNEIASCFNAFDDFMGACADLITTRITRDEVMGVLYSNKDCATQKYTYGAQNSDVYLDVMSSVYELKKYYQSTLLDVKAADFENAFNKCVTYSWNYSGTAGGIGVYFQTLSNGNLLCISHPSAYIQGKTIDQIAFVTDSQGYVPDIKNEKSLLNKLFYKSF